jgi:hypothetical protein
MKDGLDAQDAKGMHGHICAAIYAHVLDRPSENERDEIGN